ncbi:hypothetical protein ISS30_01685 [bacterium]|nr:hypothetical protein [bacterium]
MSLNQTLNYLKSDQTLVCLCFSDTLTTISKYLYGAGAAGGDGFPMPAGGVALSVHVWDGSNVRSDSDIVEFQQGDRISVYAQYDVDHFIIYVRKNGVNTTIHADEVLANATILVTVWLRLDMS